MGNGASKCEWRHAPEVRGGFREFWRKLVELRLDTKRDSWLLQAHEALWQVSHEMEGRWKSQNRKIVPLSPYVEKPLNSKVIKCFVPEQRSRKCFSCFEIPMFYVICVIYIWTSHVHFAYSCIWLWYNILNKKLGRLLMWRPGHVCCLDLWHINLCRLFNAKSIFIKIKSSISNNSV